MTIARMLAAISGSKLAASVLFLPDFQPQTSSGFCPEGGVEDTTEQEKLTTVGTVGTSRSVQTHTHTIRATHSQNSSLPSQRQFLAAEAQTADKIDDFTRLDSFASFARWLSRSVLSNNSTHTGYSAAMAMANRS